MKLTKETKRIVDEVKTILSTGWMPSILNIVALVFFIIAILTKIFTFSIIGWVVLLLAWTGMYIQHKHKQ